jgi:integrase/recombinase XerD
LLTSSDSISSAVLAFIEHKVVRYGSTNTTAITYRSILGDFSRWCKQVTIETLTLDMIDTYIMELANHTDKTSGEHYKPKTFKNKIVVIRSLIRYLYAKNLTNIRPESIEIPRVQETEANFLDDDEQNSLIDCIDDPRDRAIILTMLRSGLRVSEIVDLRTDDLFERSIVVRSGKGKKPRVTFISKDAETAIQTYLNTKPYTTSMFTNYRGEKLSRQYIARIVSLYGSKSATHKHISPHTLRHTFATNMLRKGARIEDIQPMMGHANISTTRLYMHFTNDYLHQRYDEIMDKKVLT